MAGMADIMYSNTEVSSQLQHNFVDSFSRKTISFLSSVFSCLKSVPGFVEQVLNGLSPGSETRLPPPASEKWDVKVCVREEEEMWRPYAAVVCLLWLLLLISCAAMCCQVAWALLSALSIYSEKHNVKISLPSPHPTVRRAWWEQRRWNTLNVMVSRRWI